MAVGVKGEILAAFDKTFRWALADFVALHGVRPSSWILARLCLRRQSSQGGQGSQKRGSFARHLASLVSELGGRLAVAFLAKDRDDSTPRKAPPLEVARQAGGRGAPVALGGGARQVGVVLGVDLADDLTGDVGFHPALAQLVDEPPPPPLSARHPLAHELAGGARVVDEAFSLEPLEGRRDLGLVVAAPTSIGWEI